MKFYTDAMLGRLCKWLRIFGFDTLYNSNNDLTEITKTCADEQRIFLTRNVSGREKIYPDNVLLIKSEKPWEQIKQLFTDLKLPRTERIFTRCLECNEPVHQIDKESIKNKIPAKSFDSFDEFFICPKCERIYWKGTHYENTMKKILELGL